MKKTDLVDLLRSARLLITGDGSEEEFARLGSKYTVEGDEFSASYDGMRAGIIADIDAVVVKAPSPKDSKCQQLDGLLNVCAGLKISAFELMAWASYLDAKQSAIETVEDEDCETPSISPMEQVRCELEAELDDGRDGIIDFYNLVAELGAELDPDYEKQITKGEPA